MRVRLTVSYDGSGFHGFAPNAGVRTVSGELAGAIGRILRLAEPVALTCAGRTDKGVHALGQVVTFDVPDGVDVDDLARRVNRIVAPEVAVCAPAIVSDDFDARFSAIARTYRYVVWNRPEPDPFRAGRAWHVTSMLDLPALRLACDPFIGEHDFSAFCRAATRADGTPAPLTRRVHAADWHPGAPGELIFTITASSFCHQMVRSIVGTMVEVGLGQRSAGELVGVIRSRDRARAGRLAPPDGLYLAEVTYPTPGRPDGVARGAP